MSDTCRTCQWLDVPPDAKGRIIPRKDRAYQCVVPIEELLLPACIRPPRLSRTAMCPDDGGDCQFHEERQARAAKREAAG